MVKKEVKTVSISNINKISSKMSNQITKKTINNKQTIASISKQTNLSANKLTNLSTNKHSHKVTQKQSNHSKNHSDNSKYIIKSLSKFDKLSSNLKKYMLDFLRPKEKFKLLFMNKRIKGNFKKSNIQIDYDKYKILSKKKLRCSGINHCKKSCTNTNHGVLCKKDPDLKFLSYDFLFFQFDSKITIK